MAIRVALTHTTRYKYARLTSLSAQTIRLRPAPHNRTPLHSYSLKIEPAAHFLNWQQDPYNNFLARVVFTEKVPHFVVKVDLVADLEAYNPFDFFVEPDCEKYPFEYKEPLRSELAPYLERGPSTPLVTKLIERLDIANKRMVDVLIDINRTVKSHVDYVIRLEPGVQTPEETLTLGKGSCRDSGWLLVNVLRQLGLAARFASGYLIQLKADVPVTGKVDGPPSDFADLHAWCECYVPGAGWIGLDPTSGLLAAEGHIPLACTAMPQSAAPIEGALEKVETEFEFGLEVRRIVDLPRITEPYSEEIWTDVLKLGARVDDDLRKLDVRLTMGGEPTFVSSEFPNEPEWNTASMGGNKRDVADRLLRRLWSEWAPGGVLFHGQGKWYPGEPLPRWALGCYRRADGVPLWKNSELIAKDELDFGSTVDDAERFSRRLAENLGLVQNGLMPAYEDAWYHLWRERRLPTNVDPLDSRLEDAVERARLAKVFRQGLNTKVGWVLPLSYWNGWSSGRWFLRDEHCFLLPGDSAMGFRLPLDSLPWRSAEHFEGETDPDPTIRRPALPPKFTFPLKPAVRDPQALRPVFQTHPDAKAREKKSFRGEVRRAESRTASDPYAPPAPFESATGLVRTALCVEPRDGKLHIFLPPIHALEGFVELVAALETTASQLGLPIQLEGYPPVVDPRLRVFHVTPDPGVIEVNVPPVETFAELVTQNDSLYREALEENLVAEKFELDGTHVGSGGGKHLVMGGATPQDSPFLRRPDLLASLLCYWNNHPSLSYLFSGRFIGPTSQAPRVDEARHESVYELEIALAQLPNAGAQCPPWLVDRLFRHLLVDVTGNTHRTEFCIDKLYSPDGAAGRLGLLELRALEMPPHPRIATVEALLVRSLVAAFWQKPYPKRLVKWGTSLHDKFMLPFFIRQDFTDVLSDLASWGYPMPFSWFEPRYQFRFPYYGHLEKDAMVLEVRGALEPWHVLGEEVVGTGTARHVDSSVERLEIKASNLLSDRYSICCNGAEVPLHPTGVRGQSVAGIRYRAWQPPSALHPTIGVHAPLHFDLYDRWNGRSIGGCTYHVVHQGGRSNEDRPVNASAAESRRIARFEPRGHHVGAFEPRRMGVNPDYPMTLDLRRF